MFPHFPILCRSPWAKVLAARHGGAQCAVKPSPSTTLSNYGEILSHPSNETIMEPVMTARTQFPRLRAQRGKTYHFLVKLFLNLCWRLFSQNRPSSWAWNMKCETRTVHSLTLALLPQPLCVVCVYCAVSDKDASCLHLHCCHPARRKTLISWRVSNF